MRMPLFPRTPDDEGASGGLPVGEAPRSEILAPVENGGAAQSGAAPLETAAIVEAAIAEPVAALAGPAALAALDAWFAAHVPNSPLSRDTGVHNRIVDGVSLIKSAIFAVKE